MDDRVPAADGPNGQLTDLQLVANVYRLAGLAQLFGGLRIGVERGIRIALEQRRQPGVSTWSGCWWVIRMADSPVIPSKPCAKFPGSKSTRGVVELGK